MDTTPAALGTFVRVHLEEVLAAWGDLARELPASASLPYDTLRNAFAEVVEALAEHLITGAIEAPQALEEHVLQRLEIGMPCGGVTAELMALRDAIECVWPGTHHPESRTALRSLRTSVDGMILATIERFVGVRSRVIDAVDAALRGYPAETAAESLEEVLRTLLFGVEGIDTASILLREGDELRVRAAVGVEEPLIGKFTLRVGEGFSGLVAARRAPHLLEDARSDPLVKSPALRAGVRAVFGVPLLHGDELFGVAQIGSRASKGLSPQTKALFRALMTRVAGVLYQEALRERLEIERARYEAVVENAPTIIFSKDLEGRYVSINRRALAELGRTPEEFLGHTDLELFPSAQAVRLRATDRTVLRDRRQLAPQEDEFQGPRGPRTYLTIKFPIVRGDEVLGVGGVATDITERRQWERRQLLLADVSGLLTSSLEVDVALSRVVQRVVPVLADASIIEVVRHDGTTRTEMHPPDAAAGPGDPQLTIPLAARDQPLGTWFLIRRDGFDDADIELAYELGWRLSLSLDNARLYELSKRAVRERDQVLGVVAHDLRNPLGHILMAARLGRVRDIEQIAGRMKRLVGDLVDRHAIERGRLAVELQRVPAHKLVRRAAEGVHDLALDVPDELPDVMADEGRICQVFQNLIENAAKFSPLGSEVTVRARARDGEVLVCVRDRGPGIDDDVLPHVFDRFWQGNSTDRRGVGLGLAICKGIVEAHGGRVWAANAEDGGAKLCFSLPVATTAPSRSPAGVS